MMMEATIINFIGRIAKPLRRLVLIWIVSGFVCSNASAQIGINNEEPDPSSVLDLSATDKGLLIPRMTTAQRTAIISPANSLLVYDITVNLYFYFNNGDWYPLTTWMPASSVNDIQYSSGNVGIGNSSPVEKLQIGTEGKINIRVGRWATFGETGNALATIVGNNARASTMTGNVMEYIATHTGGAKAVKLQFDEGITFHTSREAVTAGQTFSGYERMRIDNNGNVGIATTAPQDRLHVGTEGKSNMRVGYWATFGETGNALATIVGNNARASTTTGNVMEYVASHAGGGKAIKMQFDEGISFHTSQIPVTAGQTFTGYERMRIDNAGNVGIGTISAASRLQIADGPAGEQLRLSRGT